MLGYDKDMVVVSFGLQIDPFNIQRNAGAVSVSAAPLETPFAM
jgi:hypothetical protein